MILDGGIQCDLRVVSDAEFPFALAYFTGSKEHNIVMRQRAIQRGLRLNEYGLFKSKEETRDPKLLVPCKTEEEIFEKLDLPFIPPELREDHGEFAAAEKNELPRLIEWTDLKGSLHNHSNWSDGHNTLEEIAALHGRIWAWNTGRSPTIRNLRFRRTAWTRNGCASKSWKSKKSTKNLRRAASDFRLLTGSEVDILKDRLDFDDDVAGGTGRGGGELARSVATARRKTRSG